jgi:hypothetical protein
MRMPSVIFTAFAFLFLLFVGSTGVIQAQSEQQRPMESSFEITLSVVAGSNDPGQRSELPAALAPIAKQLRASFGLTSLKLADTYIGRIGNNGTISYKSLTTIDGRASSDTPSFLDWQVVGLRNAAGTDRTNVYYIHAFHFGARVPVVVGDIKTGSPIQYESIGLNVERITVGQNTPVLIGTIALPKADGRVFLVLTVSPAGI